MRESSDITNERGWGGVEGNILKKMPAKTPLAHTRHKFRRDIRFRTEDSTSIIYYHKQKKNCVSNRFQFLLNMLQLVQFNDSVTCKMRIREFLFMELWIIHFLETGGGAENYRFI